MSILSQNSEKANENLGTVEHFLSRFHVGKLLRKCNANKEKGIPVMQIFRYMICNIFSDRSMYMQLKTGNFEESFSKNTFYRFLNMAKTNWLRFTTILSLAVVDFIRPLTSEDRADVFIFDDTLYSRSGYKKTELCSKVFDHVSMKFKTGYRLLTLSWSDGTSLVPINSALLASSKEENVLGSVKKTDKRTLAGKRRVLATEKATDVMIHLLETALNAGHKAKYVLFDTWFSNPAQILKIKDLGINTIAMVKNSSRIHYEYNGSSQSIRQIYNSCKKRRGRSRYLLSVEVSLKSKEDPSRTEPARIVCVRNRTNKKKWLAILCTDMNLSEEEIIRIYGKRWDIEIFFKTCKTYLGLLSECHSLSYDALTAHVAIVFVRYMLLSVAKRTDEDQRTLGELFYYLVLEAEDITFCESMQIIIEAMIATVQEYFHLTEEQIEEFTADFIEKLPPHMKNRLQKRAVQAA